MTMTSLHHRTISSRPRVVATIVLGALIVNVILWLIGLAAGGTFAFTDNGEEFSAAPGGVVMLTVAPLLVGTGVAAAISVKWAGVIRIAEVIGAVAALGTVALTLQADFDAVSTVALSLMHVVIAVVLVVGLERMRALRS
ncbi:DUF6069 family protein [Actinomycetes bacterium M1A6_2h]